MTSKPGRDLLKSSELAAAAAALDAEVKRFEELATVARKTPLNSEKNLERAAKALTEVAESDERLGAHVKALVDAITEIRDRQQAHAEEVHAVATQLQARTDDFQVLLKSFALLGEEAAKINALVQAIAATKRDTAEATAQVAERLGEVQERMSLVADGAQALSKAATAKDFVDIARSADSLRQQLLGAKNKMGLLQKNLLPSS